MQTSTRGGGIKATSTCVCSGVLIHSAAFHSFSGSQFSSVQFLRQGLVMQSRLAPKSQSHCLSTLTVEITGVYRHAPHLYLLIMLHFIPYVYYFALVLSYNYITSICIALIIPINILDGCAILHYWICHGFPDDILHHWLLRVKNFSKSHIIIISTGISNEDSMARSFIEIV